MSELVSAIRELTEELRRYNRAHEPQKRQRGEAELFKADSEAESKREMHEEIEALSADQPRRGRTLVCVLMGLMRVMVMG